MEKGLTMVETRDRVRELLGKELKWRLMPLASVEAMIIFSHKARIIRVHVQGEWHRR